MCIRDRSITGEGIWLSIEAAREHLKKWGRDQDIIEFDASSATVPLAALAVGCEPGRIAKTLSFQAEEGCLLIVTAGDAKIDNAKYKARLGRLSLIHISMCIRDRR